MELSDNIFDRHKMCPVCTEKECLYFEYLPESKLSYSKDGEDYTIHLPASRDYTCRSCDANFLLIDLEDE